MPHSVSFRTLTSHPITPPRSYLLLLFLFLFYNLDKNRQFLQGLTMQFFFVHMWYLGLRMQICVVVNADKIFYQ